MVRRYDIGFESSSQTRSDERVSGCDDDVKKMEKKGYRDRWCKKKIKTKCAYKCIKKNTETQTLADVFVGRVVKSFFAHKIALHDVPAGTAAVEHNDLFFVI